MGDRQFPTHQAQRTSLPRAVTCLQLERPCKPGQSSLSYKFTHDSTSLRQPAENGADKKKGGLHGVDHQLDVRTPGLGPSFAPEIKLI